MWGGSTLAQKGFDCSGAIHHVSKMLGKPIPRTTSAKMYLHFKGNLHWSEASCGHLVWFTFAPNRPYGHIGMHSTGNRFWHSGSSTGPTRVVLIKSGYWDGIFEASKPYPSN